MKCPHCQKPLADDPTLAGQLVICPLCGGEFGLSGGPADPPSLPQIVSTNQARKYQRYAPSDGIIYPSAGSLNPVLAVFLSLILIGLPQMVMGQAIKGVVILIVGLLLGIFTGCIACLITWPVAAIDAYCIAQKLQRGQPVRQWEFF